MACASSSWTVTSLVPTLRVGTTVVGKPAASRALAKGAIVDAGCQAPGMMRMCGREEEMTAMVVAATGETWIGVSCEYVLFL